MDYMIGLSNGRWIRTPTLLNLQITLYALIEIRLHMKLWLIPVWMHFRLPRQTIRENANVIILFPQDANNLIHKQTDYCETYGVKININLETYYCFPKTYKYGGYESGPHKR